MITRVIEGCVRWVRGVELSDDCLMRRAPGFGAIAQLGERVLCKHEVVGSIPSGSTIFVGTGDSASRSLPPAYIRV